MTALTLAIVGLTAAIVWVGSEIVKALNKIEDATKRKP
jgi:hypothetical protein